MEGGGCSGGKRLGRGWGGVKVPLKPAASEGGSGL